MAGSRARYVDQGGGKRKGAFAIYLEPWHSDIFDWLDLRKNHGKEEARCRDLFYGLWISDLFMQARGAKPQLRGEGTWQRASACCAAPCRLSMPFSGLDGNAPTY